MSGPEYTTCVKKEDYSDYSAGSLILGGGWWEATDYMLHRKLVCLGSVHPGNEGGKARLTRSDDPGSSCAIGRIVSFEPPSSKSGFEAIDNDFSFNILLRPTDEIASLSDDPFSDDAWRKKTDAEGLDAVLRGYQGEFLIEQDTPRPHEAHDGDPRYAGYTSDMFFDSTRHQSGTSAVFGLLQQRFVWFRDGSLARYPTTADGAYTVPVLHCECEGTRIRDVFNVADQMPGGGAGCKKHWWTRLGCFFLHLLFWPFTSAFVAEAWGNARDGNYHDAMDGNGDLSIGDLVLVRGRWVFDAGHKGYNEIHAVRTIQKIPERPDHPGSTFPAPDPPPGSPPERFEDFYMAWCELAGAAPPDHGPGKRPEGMTATQTVIFDAQQAPENHYSFHPDLDGCAPGHRPVVNAVEPSELERFNGDRDVTVIGSGFEADAIVTVDGPSIAVKASKVQSPTRIVATLTLASDAATGSRTLSVTNPEGSVGSCECLAIFEAPDIR